MNCNQTFEKEVAAIAYATDFHPTFDIAVTYLAIGKENFVRLKEIQSTLNGSFLHVFNVVKDQKKAETGDLDAWKAVRQNVDNASKEPELSEVEPGTMELLEGEGFENIRVGYHAAFSERVPVDKYERAYILHGKLVLIQEKYEDGQKKAGT